MEREACVCDHGFERSDLRAEIIIIIIITGIVVLELLYFIVDSHIQRIVLATEETTVTQQVSHIIDLSNTNPACGQKEVRMLTGHTIMVTTRYSDQQRSKSRQKVMRLYKQ